MDNSPFDPRPDSNIEDRRDEFSPWQHLLMYLGVPPIDRTENAAMGIPPGHYDAWDYIEQNPEGPSDLNPPSRLQKAAGLLDLPTQAPGLKTYNGMISKIPARDWTK